MQKMNRIAIGCMFYAIAMFFSVCISVFIKKTMVQYNVPSWEVVAIRQGAIVLLMLPFMIKMKFNFFDKKALKLNFARNAIYTFTLWLLYSSLVKMPVNASISIQFLVPIVATILAMIFLKERGSKMIWIALIICICGSCIIKGSIGFESKSESYAYIMLAIFVLLRGITVTLNGKLAMCFNTSTLVFYANTIMFLLSLLFCWQFVYVPPIVFLILSCAGLLYCFEYILIFRAHKYCTVLTLQPMEFSKMIYSIILSSLILGETTTKNQILGSTVIALGFVCMILGKNKIEKKRTELKD